MFSYGFPKHWSTLRKLLWLKLLQGAAAIVETVTGTLPLTLANALSHAIVSLTRYGKCEQRNLPSEYTQVDYIEGNGTASYLDTGIVLNTVDLEIEVDYQFTETPGAASPAMVWGYMGNSSNLPRWGFGAYGGKWLGSVNQTAADGYFDTSRHTAVLRAYMDGESPMWDGTLDGVGLYTAASLPNLSLFTGNALPVMLFARNNNGTAGNFAPAKIYAFKVRKAGVLVNNFVPCKSGNTVGFYDTVTGNFITGTGLSAGDDSVPSPSTPMDLWCNNGRLLCDGNVYDKTTMGTIRQVCLYADNNLYFASSNGGFVIPIKPNTTYTVDTHNSNVTIFRIGTLDYVPWDATTNNPVPVNNYVKQTNNTPITFTSGANDRYLFIQVNLALAASVANTLTVTTTEVYADGTPEVLTVYGQSANLFDGEWTVGWGIVNSTGAIVAAADRYTFYIPAVEGDVITISRAAIGESTYFYYGTYAEEPYTNNQACVSYGVLGANSLTGTVTVPSGANYVAFFFGAGPSTGVTVTKRIAQTVTDIPMLLSTGESGVDDEVNFISGIKAGKVRAIVFDGTESDWTFDATYDRAIIRPLPNFKSATTRNIKMLCTHFVSKYNGEPIGDLTVGDFYNAAQNGLVFHVAQTSLEDWKAYLAAQYAAGTPVIVIYPRAAATTEQTTAHHLSTHGGNNIVDSVANVGPVEAKVEYMKAA